jgi:hypothetical protein
MRSCGPKRAAKRSASCRLWASDVCSTGIGESGPWPDRLGARLPTPSCCSGASRPFRRWRWSAHRAGPAAGSRLPPRRGAADPAGGSPQMLRNRLRWRRRQPVRPGPHRLSCAPRAFTVLRGAVAGVALAGVAAAPVAPGPGWLAAAGWWSAPRGRPGADGEAGQRGVEQHAVDHAVVGPDLVIGGRGLVDDFLGLLVAHHQLDGAVVHHGGASIIQLMPMPPPQRPP